MQTLCRAQLLRARDTFGNYWYYYHRIFPCLRGMPLHVHLCQLHIYQWVFFLVYSGMLYILFALLLGAVCSRHALLTDYMIASKVSLVGVLFLFGLYISSLSSCLGAQYGAPRVLQCISKENVLPIIRPLGKGVRILGLQPRDKEAMLGDKKILTLFSWVNLAAVTSAVNQQLPHSLHFFVRFLPCSWVPTILGSVQSRLQPRHLDTC